MLLSVSSNHESLKWLKSQKIETLSDCLIQWNQFFSLYYFDNIAYLPGEQNVPADFCSRPPTNVYVLRATSSAPVTRVSYDTVDLATLFDACSHVQSPVEAIICACVESTVNAEFLQRVRRAQQADSGMGDIL